MHEPRSVAAHGPPVITPCLNPELPPLPRPPSVSSPWPSAQRRRLISSTLMPSWWSIPSSSTKLRGVRWGMRDGSRGRVELGQMMAALGVRMRHEWQLHCPPLQPRYRSQSLSERTAPAPAAHRRARSRRSTQASFSSAGAQGRGEWSGACMAAAAAAAQYSATAPAARAGGSLLPKGLTVAVQGRHVGGQVLLQLPQLLHKGRQVGAAVGQVQLAHCRRGRGRGGGRAVGGRDRGAENGGPVCSTVRNVQAWNASECKGAGSIATRALQGAAGAHRPRCAHPAGTGAPRPWGKPLEGAGERDQHPFIPAHMQSVLQHQQSGAGAEQWTGRCDASRAPHRSCSA